MALRKLTITDKNRNFLDGKELSDSIIDYQIKASGGNPNIGYLTITLLVQVTSIGIPVEEQKACSEQEREETSMVNKEKPNKLSKFSLILSLTALAIALLALGIQIVSLI